jgi:hypothetical protein
LEGAHDGAEERLEDELEPGNGGKDAGEQLSAEVTVIAIELTVLDK